MVAPIPASAQEEAERRFNLNPYAPTDMPYYLIERDAFVAGSEWKRTQASARIEALNKALEYRMSWIHDLADNHLTLDWKDCLHPRCVETRRLIASPAPGDEQGARVTEHRVEMLNMGGGILRAFCSCGKLALFTDAKAAFDVMNAHQHEPTPGVGTSEGETQ